jgi:hypothetical protein
VDLLKSKNIHPKAMLNMDMVGRLVNNSITIFGANSAAEWKKIVARQCEQNVMMCSAGGDGYGPSDHMPFYIARVPVLHFFTGAHPDYHRSTDTIDKVNPVGGVQVAELVADIAMEAADRRTLLTYVKAAGTNTMSVLQRSHGDLKGNGAYLGTIPNYGEMTATVKANTPDGVREVEAPKGVLLSGVREKSPAAEAGVRGGDIIVGMIVLDQEPGFAAVTPKVSEIQNLQDYTYVLSNLKPGMRVKLQIWRKGESLELPATVGRKGANE